MKREIAASGRKAQRTHRTDLNTTTPHTSHMPFQFEFHPSTRFHLQSSESGTRGSRHPGAHVSALYAVHSAQRSHVPPYNRSRRIFRHGLAHAPSRASKSLSAHCSRLHLRSTALPLAAIAKVRECRSCLQTYAARQQKMVSGSLVLREYAESSAYGTVAIRGVSTAKLERDFSRATPYAITP